jgi:hypothetical protein
MAQPNNPVFRKLYRLSVSQNIYVQIVKPLAVFQYGDNPTHSDIKDLVATLTELHKTFWNNKGPAAYEGAVAGRFEELLSPLRHAQKEDGRYVKISAEGKAGAQKEGGDLTIVKIDGRTLTYQIKVSNAANTGALESHINKAAAQLSGQTGERPQSGSERYVYLLAQNTEAFESYKIADWKALVERAIAKDYNSDNRTVTAATLGNSVDIVKIVTKRNRFRLTVNHGIVSMPYNAVKDASDSKYYAFAGSKLHTHWKWLVKWFDDNVETLAPNAKQTLVNYTKNSGVGSPNAFPDLPNQPIA